MTREVLSPECEIWQGDCLEVLPLIGKVDAVVTDPPYGIGEDRDAVMSREKLAKPIDYGEFHWDKKLPREYIDALLQAGKHQVIFGGNYYADWLPASSSWIVWDKLNGDNDFADCELAWTSHKKAVRIFRYLWNGMMKQHPEKRYHPTQKPLALIRWVLENYTNPGDLVLDPFSGSFTTGVACHQTGRRFIGIELDPTYYALGRRRLLDALAQPRLPGVDA